MGGGVYYLGARLGMKLQINYSFLSVWERVTKAVRVDSRV
jgi:hypothetical protein